MIYRVYIDGVSFSNMSYGAEILSGSVSLELNGAGSCTIKIPYDHQYYDLPKVNKSIIDVYEGNSIIWTGRVSTISTNWQKEKTIEAEGALAFFNDSIQRPYVWQNVNLYTFLEDVITNHNNSDVVPADLKFKIGNVTVSNVTVTKSVDYAKTFEVLQDQCIGVHGGYMFVRKEYNTDEDKYELFLDWYAEMPTTSDQPVRFGLNLLDLSTELSSTDVVTRIIPISRTEDGTITITEATDPPPTGYSIISDMLICDAAEETFGPIMEVISFDGVADANSLLIQASNYLKSKQFDHLSIECDVAELSYLDEYNAFKIGDKVNVVSTPHFIDKTLTISKMDYDLMSASKKAVMGNPPRQTLSEITGTGTGGTSSSYTSSSGGGGGGGGGGGSSVTVTPIILTGEDIAYITVDGHRYTLKYLNTKTEVAYTSEIQNGHKIGELSLDGTSQDILSYREVYSGETTPASSIGNDGDAYLHYAYDNPNILQYVRTNYSSYGADFTNWEYNPSHKFELTYKMISNPRAKGDWPGIIGNGTVDLGINFNFFSNRQVINVRYRNNYTGDGNVGYDSPFDYENFYKLTMNGGHYILYKGPKLDNITTIAAETNLGWYDTTHTAVKTVKLFGAASSTYLDLNFYGLKVYDKDDVLLHDYVPYTDGIYDRVDDIVFETESTTHINGPRLVENRILKQYLKKNGSWMPDCNKEVIELTQKEYDDLTTEEKEDLTKVYFVY